MVSSISAPAPRPLVLLLFILIVSVASAQPITFEGAPLVYMPKPLRVDDLKREFGANVVQQIKPGLWHINKPLNLIVPFDSFTYQENAAGILVEMTGAAVGSCDKMVPRFLKAGQHLDQYGRTAHLPAKMVGSGLTVESLNRVDGLPNFGGQSIDLIYSEMAQGGPCTFMQTMRRKP